MLIMVGSWKGTAVHQQKSRTCAGFSQWQQTTMVLKDTKASSQKASHTFSLDVISPSLKGAEALRLGLPQWQHV